MSKPTQQEYDSSGRPVYKKKKSPKKKPKTKTRKKSVSKETTNEESVEESKEGPAPDPAFVAFANEDQKERPTVAFELPDDKEVPEVMEVTYVNVAADVEDDSTEPQALITLDDATYEVSDDVDLVAVKVDDEDVIVAIDPDIKKNLENEGIDIQTDLEEAVKKAGLKKSRPKRGKKKSLRKKVAIPAELELEESPEPIEVEVDVDVPDELDHVVELAVENDELVIKEVEEPIDNSDVLVPVITKDDQDDIVVVVPEPVADWCKKHKIDVEKDVSFAVIVAEATVVTFRKTVVRTSQ